MFDCKNLVHPFQNDPGCSQSQRVLDDLLGEAASIDGRTLADLLNYFMELSSYIRYSYAFYDPEKEQYVLNGDKDWRSFFNTSLPFILASATKNSADVVNEKFRLYNQLFVKNPSEGGLQLLIHFFYYSTVYKIDKLYNAVADSGLPVAIELGQLIKNKLQAPVTVFIKTTYSAYRLFAIKHIDFTPIFTSDLWNIDRSELIKGDPAITAITGRYEQFIAVQNNINDSFSSLLEGMNIVSTASGASLEQSLTGLPDDLKQRHTPHLALLFTFLNIFRKLQDDLNGYTKKHLDFFYRQVLQLQPHDAQPDKVNIVFELQKQLKQYALKKGLLVKADKDKNNAEIDFGLNDDIVVNKTQVADLRTLFLNNEIAGNKTYVEGVYMALKANTADGVDKDFSDDPKNYSTLGAKYSKYTEPGNTSLKPYPPARIGCVLASPVLLLNEGERTVDITLTCRLNDNCSKVSAASTLPDDPCCDSSGQPLINDQEVFPDFIDAARVFPAVQFFLNRTYVNISVQLIEQAKSQGLSEDRATKIRERYLKDDSGEGCPKPACCSDVPVYLDDILTTRNEWNDFLKKNQFSNEEQNFLFGIFKPFKPFKVLFSGEKDWIDPSDDVNKKDLDCDTSPPTDPLCISMSSLDETGAFTIRILSKITADKPAVTFYNKDNLKEDLGTSEPLVKIELDDTVKPDLETIMFDESGDSCCLRKVELMCRRHISLYHFFRNVEITDSNISVTVCGLKNFIVQNDESVQDVNSPVYPFGTRPKADANFYIGSNEIFYKNWQSIQVNHNWKNKPEPPDIPGTFEQYYEGYQHMFIDPNDVDKRITKGVIKDNNFKVSLAVLSNGSWHANIIIECPPPDDPDEPTTDNLLFEKIGDDNICQDIDTTYKYAFKFQRGDFTDLPEYRSLSQALNFTRLNANTRNGFLKITLRCQDFQHDQYAFILARQMMAFGRLPTDLVTGAYYRDNPGGSIVVFFDFGKIAGNLDIDIKQVEKDAKITEQKTALTITKAEVTGGKTGKLKPVAKAAHAADKAAKETIKDGKILEKTFNDLKLNFPFLNQNNKNKLEAIIPNEPWTPIITNIALDYAATADKKDISLIHLYPYKDTYKPEQLTLEPTLFPTLCDEGTLFIGLTDLVPGSNLNMLFQLAEATSDSESDTQIVYWKYLYNNQWFSLRKGFEVLDDATENLTASGIIKFALPENMTADNTIMPKGLYWIKAAVPMNSKSVCETIGIYTQAVEATFVIDPANDTSRLSDPLEAGSISKLQVADANIKQLTQPGSSFDGQVPEMTKHYYVRISELLRHKGRAIQKFDYERLTLEAFPQVFKTKCINHSFKLDANEYDNDFPIAPGYVLLAVIPDLTKLIAGKSFEPKLPTGIIEKIQAYLVQRTSPFVRIKAVNPRYEKINFCLSVILNKGYDKNFYKEQLVQDLREFLAPWAVGRYDKLAFGQCINKSDVVDFLETREYVDYITKLQMQSEFDVNGPSDSTFEVCPHTPRSILLAGEIQVCIEDDETQFWNDAPSCNNITGFLDFDKQVKVIPV